MASPHKILVITFKAILVLALSSPIAVVLLALQSGPLVPLSEPLNASEISQIEQLLVNSAPPNLSNPGLQEFSLSHDELNLLVRYAGELIGTDTEINSRILLHESTLQTEFSIPVVREFIPLYLNLGAEFASRDNELELVALTTGYLRVPGALVSNLAAWIEKQFLSGTQSYDDVTELLDSVKRISISASQLQVAFQWEPALLSQVRSQAQQFFVSRHDQQRMVRHYNVLAEVVNSLPESTRAIPLTSLFRPLFEAAQLQTSLDRNPIAENRTLLLTLAAYINQDDMAQWISPELSEQLPTARVIEVRVQQRQDLAQHIASSAALAASAGANLARIISSTKEVYDARYRSGFSFSDMTANTAGVAIGTLTTESVVSAEIMQQRMIQLNDDTDFLPPVASGHDGLSETDFSERYRDSNSSAYQEKLVQIKTFVNDRPLFKGLRIN